jgi:hypothetical protein
VTMTHSQLLPALLVVLNLGASIVCAIEGDYRRAAYWFFAACIMATVAT